MSGDIDTDKWVRGLEVDKLRTENAELRAERAACWSLLKKLYVGLQRAQWQDGLTDDEMSGKILDLLCNQICPTWYLMDDETTDATH